MPNQRRDAGQDLSGWGAGAGGGAETVREKPLVGGGEHCEMATTGWLG